MSIVTDRITAAALAQQNAGQIADNLNDQIGQFGALSVLLGIAFLLMSGVKFRAYSTNPQDPSASLGGSVGWLSGSDPSGIGAAAQRTGHGWPAPVLNTALAVYSRQDNWLENFSRYLDRWMEDIDDAAKAAAAFANYGLLLLVALSTVFTLISQVQQAF